MAIGAAPVLACLSLPPNAARTFLNSASSAASKCACSSAGTSWPAACSARTLSPTLDRALDLLGVAVGGDERVDLLEDPRHRRQVGRVDLHQLGHDLLRVAAEVGDRRRRGRSPAAGSAARRRARAGGRGRRRRPPRARPSLLAHVDHLAVVAVREHAALRRPGGARRVDDRVRVVGRDGLAARSAARPASRPRPRSRRSSSAIASPTSPVGSMTITCSQRRAGCSRTSTILATCAASSQTIATRLGVAGHPLALARASWSGRSAPRRRRRSRSRSRTYVHSGRVAHSSETRSPGSMPRSIRPRAISETISPSSA